MGRSNELGIVHTTTNNGFIAMHQFKKALSEIAECG
jgi:hypothetical protein